MESIRYNLGFKDEPVPTPEELNKPIGPPLQLPVALA
jgi:hypothetical protein